MSTRPGAPILLYRDALEIDPDREITELRDGKITSEEWAARCAKWGLA
jgi:hypothetical protein